MAFHSFSFIAGFLPLSILLYVLLNKIGQFRLALVGLIGMSLTFAAWRSGWDMALILLSMCANYLIGFSIHRYTSLLSAKRKYLLILGLTINLALLGYFKYSTFLLENLNVVMGTAYPLSTNYLPLGISFLTFQQIAYLVDVYRGQVTTFHVLEYGLFCSFFPKMLAGPIVRYGEFAPQLRSAMRSFSSGAFAEGITLFSIGLFKKLVLADTLAAYANPIFSADSQAGELGLVEAWGGILAYTFQLYFDFSGYTDMALGLARLFGIVLPENFNSPYKATSITDFWTRWHMTLSRFLRDYLYIPLGGNRSGLLRQQLHVMITMALCGLWHGASWTFVIWGALHGLYLMINHGWRKLGGRCSHAVGWSLTFLSVSMAWVWFRAETVSAALRISASLAGLNGLWANGLREALHSLEKPAPQFTAVGQFFTVDTMKVAISFDHWTVFPINFLLSEPALHLFWLLASSLIVLRLPNTHEWMHLDNHSPPVAFTMRRGMFIGALLFLVLLASMTTHPSGFIYQNF